MTTLIAAQIDEDDSASEKVPETLADLVHRLGDIPLERIRLRPAPGTGVEEDFIREDLRLCELIDGVVVEMAMGFFESRLGLVLGAALDAFLKGKKLGFVVGADGLVRLAPGRLRIPDVGFYRWDRFPDRKVPVESIGPVAPTLAIEILSRGNTKREIAEKRKDFFAAGTQLMWIMDPKKKTVSVYRSEDDCRVIEEDGHLDGEDLLPGFSLSIREWIETASGERD